jgi:hypothetical protein
VESHFGPKDLVHRLPAKSQQSIVELLKSQCQRHVLNDQEQIDVVPSECEREIVKFQHEGVVKVVRNQLDNETITLNEEQFPKAVIIDTAVDALLFDGVNLGGQKQQVFN